MKNLILLLALVANLNLLYAQEINIPADTSGQIYVINAELAQRLNLFKDYENFQEARLYKIDESKYVLEVNFRKVDLSLRNRIIFDQSQLDSFRIDFSNKLALLDNTKPLDQTGRLQLIINSTILGLGFWGWALPTMLEVNNGAVSAGLYLLTAGTSFAVPYFLTTNSNITKAIGNYTSYGGYAGIVHGLLLFDLINGGISNAPSNAVIGTIMFSSITEMIVNYAIAKNQNFNSGKASTLISTSIFGAFLGFALSDFFSLYDTPGAWSGVTIATSGLGYLTGDILTKNQSYSEGDAIVLTASGLLGAALPISIVALTNPSESKPYSLAGAIGAGIGLWLGNYLTSGVDFETSQGDYIMLGTLGGGLIGAGIGLIITSSGESRNSIPLFATAGGIGGFTALYLNFKGKSPKPSMSHLNLQFNPLALCIPLISNKNSEIFTPLLQFQMKF